MILDELTFSDQGLAHLRFKKEDGSFVRRAITPGGDLSGLDRETRDAIAQAWTPTVVTAYHASLPAPPTASELREATIAAISAEHDRRVADGCSVEVEGLGPVPLTGRPKDQTVILALLVNAQGMVAAGVTDPVIFFTDGDGADRMLTPAQMIELARKGMEWVDAMHRRQRELKAMDPLPADFTSDDVWVV
jgi:hypothetical protein